MSSFQKATFKVDAVFYMKMSDDVYLQEVVSNKRLLFSNIIYVSFGKDNTNTCRYRIKR